MQIKPFYFLTIILSFLFVMFSYAEASEYEYVDSTNNYSSSGASDDGFDANSADIDYAFSQSIKEDHLKPKKSYHHEPTRKRAYSAIDYDDASDESDSRLPNRISPPGEKFILVDPRVHAWGAYSSNGNLLRSGLATAGARWCRDIDRPCKTKSGVFRIYSLGNYNCISNKYPVGEGGAPMPYCMYFNGGQGLHGSHELAEANISHGCVRISVSDAEWLRFNFSQIGTKVLIRPY